MQSFLFAMQCDDPDDNFYITNDNLFSIGASYLGTNRKPYSMETDRQFRDFERFCSCHDTKTITIDHRKQEDVEEEGE